MFGFKKELPPSPAHTFKGRLERIHTTNFNFSWHSVTFLLEGHPSVFFMSCELPTRFPWQLSQAGDEVSFGIDAQGRVMSETFANLTLLDRLGARG